MAKAGSLKVFLTANSDRLTAEIKKARQSVSLFGKSSSGTFKALQNSIFSLRGAFVGLAGGASLGLLIKESVRASDMMIRMNSQLKIVSKSTQELQMAQSGLFNIAQETRSSYEATVELYARMARATQELGTSQSELFRITETVNKAIIASGASATEANAAIIQLSQGLGAGALRGDELRSVLEQTPRLARAIADGLGVPIGKLRELGQAGELTAEKVTKALLSQSDVIDEEYGKVGETVAQAYQRMKNELDKFLDAVNKEGGLNDALRDTLNLSIQIMNTGLPAILQFMNGFKDVEARTSIVGLREDIKDTLMLMDEISGREHGIIGRVLGAEAADAETLGILNTRLQEYINRIIQLQSITTIDITLPPIVDLGEDEKTQKERLKIEEKTNKLIMKMRESVTSKSINLLALMGANSKKFAVAAIAIEAALAAKKIFIESQVAAAAALTPPPIGLGPVAGQSLAASILSAGKLSAGLTLAAGAFSIHQATRSGGGGISGGFGATGTFDANPISGLPEEKRGGITQITVIGRPGIQYDNDTMDELIDNIRDAVERGDKILIDKQSRNGLELAS